MVVETSDGHAFRWRAVSHKLRGRGKGAPEQLIGAGGIFQLEIFDRFGRRVLRKGLLFQAKVDWRNTDTRLLGQGRDMLRQSDSSIVIDYTDEGYKAISASEVVVANGDRRLIPKGENKRLSAVLGDEFVGCIRGDRGMYWDSDEERLMVHGNQESDMTPSNVIAMSVQ